MKGIPIKKFIVEISSNKTKNEDNVTNNTRNVIKPCDIQKKEIQDKNFINKVS